MKNWDQNILFFNVIFEYHGGRIFTSLKCLWLTYAVLEVTVNLIIEKKELKLTASVQLLNFSQFWKLLIHFLKTSFHFLKKQISFYKQSILKLTNLSKQQLPTKKGLTLIQFIYFSLMTEFELITSICKETKIELLVDFCRYFI